MKLIGVKNNIQVLLVPNYRDLRYSTINTVDEDGRKEIILIFEKFCEIIWYE